LNAARQRTIDGKARNINKLQLDMKNGLKQRGVAEFSNVYGIMKLFY